MTPPNESPLLYRITVRALPDAVPAAARLRRLLTYALRVCRIRCVGIEGLPVARAEEPSHARDVPLP